MKKILLFALGHYGHVKDEITSINHERFLKLKELSNIYPDADIITSGGECGGEYVMGYSWCVEKEYLVHTIGIDEKKIIGGFVIYNTAEQIFLVHKIAKGLGYDTVIIITSDYHIDRTQELIKNIWDSHIEIFVESSMTHFNTADLQKHAEEHETISLHSMRKDGFYLNERLEKMKNFSADEIIMHSS